ncbi:MAG TPA: hypothetical protein PKJ33_01895 [Alphaproteobacteria bacterium]|nr:hypothetical protein [Alphaproteobacteria bacterium]
MLNKLESYDKATRELVLLAEDYEIPQIGKYSLPEIVSALRESFKNPETHKKVFGNFLEEQYDFSDDFCLISHFYISLKTGGSKQWKLIKGSSHWWLEHLIISGPFDITRTQFSKPFQYRSASIENRINTDSDWTRRLKHQAIILGKCAGLE